MIIIGNNLSSLATQQSICKKDLVEEFCIKVKLGKEVFVPKRDSIINDIIEVTYDRTPQPKSLFTALIVEDNLSLEPKEAIIACSNDIYKIPKNCFGLLQTKGTLARTFVSITCNDGQLEPGFEGKITLEIVNHSPWRIKIPLFVDVGQIYLIKCSTNSENGYDGRYAEISKNGPTIPIWRSEIT